MNNPDLPNEPAKRPPPANPRIVESADLFGGKKLVMIHHENEYYRLTVTRNDKLILQK